MVTGTKFVIVPTVLPNDAPDKSVTFMSSDPTIATVDENGVVSALVGGECQIVVTTNESGLKATCTIKVKEYVESIKISGNPKNLNVNNSVNLKVTVGKETASNKSGCMAKQQYVDCDRGSERSRLQALSRVMLL